MDFRLREFELMLQRVYRTIRRLAPARYRCPVCGTGVSDFSPLPRYYADNMAEYGFPYSFDDFETLNYRRYSCPSCGASDRERLYALYLRKYLAEHPAAAMTVLEIAPSEPFTRFLRERGRITVRTADLAMQNVDDRVDITRMTCYGADAFDGFICSHVLEHVPDDRGALRELYRVLKPGGWGILMVPILLGTDETNEDPSVEDAKERWRRFGQNDHIRLYSKQGFLERVGAAGFRTNQCGRDYFGAEAFDQNGLAARSVLYVVEKEVSSVQAPANAVC